MHHNFKKEIPHSKFCELNCPKKIGNSGLNTEGRIALFTSELVESDLIMLKKTRVDHGQGQGYKF